MIRHVLLTPHSRNQGRWQEAFGEILLAGHPLSALHLSGEHTVLWVDATQRDWLRSLHATRPDLVVVAITLHPSADEAMAMFEAGARGYCHALAAPELLQQVATVVSNGGLWLGPDLMNHAAAAIARSVMPEPNGEVLVAGLSPRESAVAAQVLTGASNKEVAERLDITPRTVKAHLGAIFEKLHVRDRLQLVVVLRRAGLGAAS